MDTSPQHHFRFFDNLRVQLLIFVLLCLLPMLTLILLNAQQQRASAIDAAQEQTLLLTRSIAERNQTQIESTRDLLLTLSNVPILRNNEIERCNEMFTELLTQYDNYTNIGMMDSEGTVLCSGLPQVIGLNFQQDYWFQQVMKTESFQLGQYGVGQFTRRPVIPAGYPIYDEQGQLKGALSVTLALDWLGDYVSAEYIPAETTITIIDANNTVLVRYPEAEKWLGKTYLNTFVLEEIARQKEGSTEGVNSKGQERLYGFTSMNAGFLEAYIIVGTLKEVAYADVTASTQRNLFALALVGFMIIVMTWIGSNRLTRPVTHLVDAAERLTEGDLSTRVMVEGRIRELVRLASCFNRMADSIEKRVADRTAELQEANENLRQEIEIRQHVEQELQKNAERLKASNQALESFAYTASHDLQEPLRKIQTFSSRLRDKYGDVLGNDDYLQRILSASNRMRQLIRDLLAYSRVSSESKPFQAVDLNRIIREIQSDLEGQIERTGGTIQVAPLPTIHGDEVQMQLLFQNLIQNALKYHRPGVPPEVRIYATESRENSYSTHQIHVVDNGIGFEEKYAERIFGLFERLHGRSEYEGTGVGLAICWKIVEKHNGSIRAASQPGKGSQFIVTLPE